MKVTYEHLVGKQYDPVSQHCWQLVRDFYFDNFDLQLGGYAIPSDWNADKLDLIGMIYEQEGFEKVTDWTLKTLRPGDLLCTAVMASNPNHFCIYVGGNEILHHPLARLSRVELLRDFWRMNTCYVLRHPSVPDLTPELPTTSIQELLDARYFPQAEA